MSTPLHVYTCKMSLTVWQLIGKLKNAATKPLILPSAMAKINDLGIFRKQRGCCAGRSILTQTSNMFNTNPLGSAVDRNNINIPCNEFKSHLFPTIISNRQEKSCSTTRGINSKNLVKINCNFFNYGKSLKITYMNVRSVNNKTQEIGQHVLDFESVICLITETWLRSGDDITLRQFTPVGYSLLQVPRSNKSGGGVAMLFKSGLNIKEQPAEAHSTFEHMEALL